MAYVHEVGPGLSDMNPWDDNSVDDPIEPEDEPPFDEDPPEIGGFIMARRDAAIIYRVMMRLQMQADLAYETGEYENGSALNRLIGGLQYKQFGGDSIGEMLLEANHG
jgi:hypothetical protein